MEGDVNHGLPHASSHFLSDSITYFPSDQAAPKATKQVLGIYPHLSHPFRACVSPTLPLKPSPATQPGDLALLQGTRLVAPVRILVASLVV